MKKTLALAGIALLILGIGAGVLAVAADDEQPKATDTTKRFAPRPPDAGSLLVEGTAVLLHDRPQGRVIGRVGRTTEFGSPEILPLVAKHQGPWVAVRHTSLGNDLIGWVYVRPGTLAWREQPVHLEIDLSARTLTVNGMSRHPREIPVAVGAPNTPTPPGNYYVTDKLRGADFGSFYGCCILALSGHQPNLPQGWSGGDRLAIHGAPTPTWGKNVSNGCLHAPEADLRWLMRTVPLGTPVSVRA